MKVLLENGKPVVIKANFSLKLPKNFLVKIKNNSYIYNPISKRFYPI